MRSHSTSIVRRLLAALLLLLPGAAVVAQQGDAFPPARFGEPFPAAVFNDLSASDPSARIDLAELLGKKPIVLVYWIAGHRRSEEVFLELQKLVGDLPSDRLTLLGVAVPRPGIEADKIRERIATIGIKVPVLEDTGFQIGQRLQVSSVPDISIIDGEGRLRLSNGASLKQVVGYELDLAKVIRRTAETGKLISHGFLDRYFPVRELEGSMCPDFKAPQLDGSAEQEWHSLLDDRKVNVLIFWSVNCPHCRKSLPEINAWLKEHPEGVNVVSCASAGDDAVQAKTAAFCKDNGFQFPTLVDKDSSISDLYKVTSTPTIVIIRPDGVVDSAIVSGLADFGRTIEDRKRHLLGTSG